MSYEFYKHNSQYGQREAAKRIKKEIPKTSSSLIRLASSTVEFFEICISHDLL